MTERSRAALVFLALAMLAAAFRFPQLAARPMHADESINADKLGTLLEQGRFEYSSTDYHGPTLFYVSMLAARAQGIAQFTALNEVTLRSVTAVLGVALVAMHFLLVPYLGLMASACAGLFAAVSPAMVYYSRDFIHETLFIFLTMCGLLSVFGYLREKSDGRAILIGVMFGLLYATKETVAVVVACALLAGATQYRRDKFAIVGRHAALAGIAAVLVAVVLMSSFFSHPRGLVDSVLAYRTYLGRGSGASTMHVHPWTFYFERLFYFHAAGAPVWSEAAIGALALLGACVAKPGIPRFLAIYTLLMVAIYSAMPYKAPWNLLGFLQGLILLAGIGAAWAIGRAQTLVPRIAVVLLLLVGAAHLGWQARAASFQYAADPRNPWVYAHTGTDVFAIMSQVDALSGAHPAGHGMPIQVITRTNLWPLPWYLRRYTGVRWSTAVLDNVPSAPVILATPEMEDALLHKIYELPPPGHREMYVNMFDRYVELRPSVEVRGYVAKSLWDDLREKQ